MKKKWLWIIIGLFIIVGVIVSIVIVHSIDEQRRKEEEKKEMERQTLIKEIKSHYSDKIKILMESDLFQLQGGNYVKVGSIGEGQIFYLDPVRIDENTLYFKLKDIDYYLSYKAVSKTEDDPIYNERYTRYIPFNESIVTKDITHFYNENGLLYSFHKSYELPIYIKGDNEYGVVLGKQLLYVKKEDVKEIIKKENSKEKNAKSVPVINYHFLYDKSKGEQCWQEVCHEVSDFRKELQYLKDNHYVTPNTREFELYIEGNLQLPERSVMLTFDDGGVGNDTHMIQILNEFQYNATMFLITSWYKKENYLSPYVDVASHGHNIHRPGSCPGGQGSPLKCENHDKLLNDIKTSRKQLNGSTYLAYPFYEYNDYAISILKEAGITMAFAGGWYDATPGMDKMKIPRYGMSSSSTLQDFIALVN